MGKMLTMEESVARMKRLNFVSNAILAFITVIVCGCGAKETAVGQGGFTKPHASPIAGSWYPADPGELGKMLDGFLGGAKTTDSVSARQTVAFITPHAGYAYSGPTASHVYNLIRERRPKRVIIIGPSHHAAFEGLSIGDYDCYETPLGRVAIDLEAADRLRACPLIGNIPEAHQYEHSVDIQVPFLQRVLPQDSFKIVPLVAGQLGEGDFPVLAEAIKGVLTSDTIVIASSDFTHYGADFQYVPFPLDGKTRANLENLDMGAVDAIRSLRAETFLEYCRKTGDTICGYLPISLVMAVLPSDARPHLLKYAVSGDAGNDYSHSVSYVAMAFASASGRWPNPSSKESHAMNAKPRNSQTSQEMTLDDAEKATLLRIARDALETRVREGRRLDLSQGAYKIAGNLKTVCGAFVTLQKHGELRGCIGHIIGRLPLAECVVENAINSAVNDYRFSPVKPDELKDIDIEISVLTPLRKVPSYKDIIIGRHGVLLTKGGAQAVFLPQVAPEQGWGLEETLDHLARKAGLPMQAWKDPSAEFLVFEALVFSEKPH